MTRKQKDVLITALSRYLSQSLNRGEPIEHEPGEIRGAIEWAAGFPCEETLPEREGGGEK